MNSLPIKYKGYSALNLDASTCDEIYNKVTRLLNTINLSEIMSALRLEDVLLSSSCSGGKL